MSKTTLSSIRVGNKMITLTEDTESLEERYACLVTQEYVGGEYAAVAKIFGEHIVSASKEIEDSEEI